MVGQSLRQPTICGWRWLDNTYCKMSRKVSRMNQADPRVRRTRKLLRDSFVDLLAEKSFHAINVQEVADRATVNRATFYAHFDDKYALLDYVVGEWFRDELVGAGLEAASCNERNLRTLVRTVLQFMRKFHGGCRQADRDLEPILETRMQSALAEFLQHWFSDEVGRPGQAAKLVSWTVFGSAIDWAVGDPSENLDERLDQILAFVMRGLGAIEPAASTLLESAAPTR